MPILTPSHLMSVAQGRVRFPAVAAAAIGLAGCIAQAAHAQAASADPRFLPPPLYTSDDNNHVDLLSGRFDVSHPGFSIGGSDIGLEEKFIYLTESPRSSLLGSLYREAYGDDAQHTFAETGFYGETSFKFVYQAPGGFRLESGVGGETLVQTPQGFTVTLQDGTIINYAMYTANGIAVGFPDTVTRPDGYVLKYYYRTNGTTSYPSYQSIVSNSGYMLHFDANGSRTLINLATDYCAPTAVTCSLSHTWPTLVQTASSIKDPLGRTMSWTAVYGGSGTITSPQQANDHSAGITYAIGANVNESPSNADAGRIIQFNNSNSSWSYTYSWDPNITVISERPITVTRTGPNGVLHATSFHNCLTSMTDELNHTTTSTCYYLSSTALHEGRPDSVTLPEGNSVSYFYDDRGNLNGEQVRSKDGSQIYSMTLGFSATCSNTKTCNKPNNYVDPRGNQTDLTYYDWGGIKSSLGPPVNGVRPLKRYIYTQLYAYVKNASGSIVQAASPIWRLTQEIVCKQTVSADGTACSTPSDEMVTNYEYGTTGSANALLVRGKIVDATGTPLRTCYAYDNLGNKISETSPNAGLSSCP